MPRTLLANVDLNTLPLLEALLEECHISRAAKRVGRSQSSLSHTLARLRDHFGDPLLVRAGRSMALTPLGIRLRDHLRSTLDDVEAILYPTTDFDPALARLHFRIRAIVTTTWLPRLMNTLSRVAPSVTVEIVHPRDGGPDYVRALARGDLNLAFGQRSQDPGLHVEALPRERYATVVRVDHPLVDDAIDLDTFCTVGHVEISPFAIGGNVVDRALAAAARTRTITARVAVFDHAGPLIQSTDLLCTLPVTLARYCASVHGLRCVPVPVEIPPTKVFMIWHERGDAAPAETWFRRMVRESLPHFQPGWNEDLTRPPRTKSRARRR